MSVDSDQVTQELICRYADALNELYEGQEATELINPLVRAMVVAFRDALGYIPTRRALLGIFACEMNRASTGTGFHYFVTENNMIDYHIITDSPGVADR